MRRRAARGSGPCLCRAGELRAEPVGLIGRQSRPEGRPDLLLLVGDVRAGGISELGHQQNELRVAGGHPVQLGELLLALGFVLDAAGPGSAASVALWLCGHWCSLRWLGAWLSSCVTSAEPLLTSWASADSSRLRDRAAERSISNATSMLICSRSASTPLACSMTTRLVSADCNCPATISPRRMVRCCRMPIVAASASACARRSSAPPSPPVSAWNRLSEPTTWLRSLSGSAFADRNPPAIACGANCGQRSRAPSRSTLTTAAPSR